MLHFFDAELCCGRGSRVVGWCVVRKQEVTSSENGANTLLCCFTDLRGKTWTREETLNWRIPANYLTLNSTWGYFRDILKRAADTDLRLAVHREAEEAVIGLKSRRVSPDRCILLPQQRGQAGQDL